MEGPDAAHAIRDERQHVAAGAGVGGHSAGAGGPLPCQGGRAQSGDSHLTALEGDDHLVIGDEGRLSTVQGDPHTFLGACGQGWSARPSSSPRHPGPCSPALTQGEGSGAGGKAVESHAVGRDALIQVQQRVDREDHHSTWNRHAGGRAQHAPHTPHPRRPSPGPCHLWAWAPPGPGYSRRAGW